MTLAEAQARLDQYLIAEERILLNQSYKIDDKIWTMADLAAVQAGIKMWSLRVSRLTNGGMRIRRGIVSD